MWNRIAEPVHRSPGHLAQSVGHCRSLLAFSVAFDVCSSHLEVRLLIAPIALASAAIDRGISLRSNSAPAVGRGVVSRAVARVTVGPRSPTHAGRPYERR